MATAANRVPGVVSPQYGDWMHVRRLGSGAFGHVDLLKNVVTHQEIAIKICMNKHVNNQGNSQAMRRWLTEVRMMEEMKHPNIVAFIKIPESLNVEYPNQFSLGMEYCSMGDLRKLMARAEYCCGLSEYHVRDILSDIGAAISYLHDQNNMHRDLKPENIVLKPRQGFNGRYQYKVTDLGYAKDLDENSCGQSFVGTLPYLAPEFLLSYKQLRYFSQVDCWSFGLLIFECITGYRPFFQMSTELTALQILNFIRDKKDEDICAWLEPIANTKKFCDHIPQPHSLNPLFAKDLVEWLRLMLCIDERKRGGAEGKEWYPMLTNKILVKEYVQVLDVTNIRMLSIPVGRASFPNSIRKMITQETKLPESEQLLLLHNGKKPSEPKAILKQLQELQTSLQNPEEGTIYLFSHRPCTAQGSGISLPPLVQQFVDSPNMEMNDKQEKRVMQLSLNFVLSKLKISFAFHRALVSLHESISLYTKSLITKLEGFNQKRNLLAGMLHLFKNSLEKDVEEDNTQDNSAGICVGSTFKEQCQTMKRDLEEWSQEVEKGQRVAQDAQMELGRASAHASFVSDLRSVFQNLQTLRQKALDAYDNFRREKCQEKRTPPAPEETKRDREKRLKRIQNCLTPTSNYVKNLLNGRHPIFIAMKFYVNHHVQLSKLLFEVEGLLHRYDCMSHQVQEHQRNRQHSIWVMLQYMKDVYNSANEYYRDQSALEMMEAQKNHYGNLVENITNDPVFLQLLNLNSGVPADLVKPMEPRQPVVGNTYKDFSSGGQSNSVSICRPKMPSGGYSAAPPNSQPFGATPPVEPGRATPLTPVPVTTTTSQLSRSASGNSNNNNSASGCTELEISGNFPN